MAAPRHTYLLEPGRWSVRGSWLDAAGTAVPASGESRVEHGPDEWVNGRGHGCLLEESELVSAWAVRLDRVG